MTCNTSFEMPDGTKWFSNLWTTLGQNAGNDDMWWQVRSLGLPMLDFTTIKEKFWDVGVTNILLPFLKSMLPGFIEIYVENGCIITFLWNFHVKYFQNADKYILTHCVFTSLLFHGRFWMTCNIVTFLSQYFSLCILSEQQHININLHFAIYGNRVNTWYHRHQCNDCITQKKIDDFVTGHFQEEEVKILIH